MHAVIFLYSGTLSFFYEVTPLSLTSKLQNIKSVKFNEHMTHIKCTMLRKYCKRETTECTTTELSNFISQYHKQGWTESQPISNNNVKYSIIHMGLVKVPHLSTEKQCCKRTLFQLKLNISIAEQKSIHIVLNITFIPMTCTVNFLNPHVKLMYLQSKLLTLYHYLLLP